MGPATAARPQLDAAALARDARAHGLVVVAGAGLSMGPPSSLPGWTAINDAFLESLAGRVAEHTDGEAGVDVLQFILERREQAAAAQPDLQAQLAEESLGEHYFAVFAPLDIETWNDGHAAIAALATTGLVRAVVTTNFDRLIELALEAAGAVPDVYCAPEDFERLAELEGSEAPAGIPVIKVHGSVGRAETMVDTLRQRVLGRPKALEAALERLFREHAVLVVGFSGADLAYDPKYLGLRDGAAGSPSFTVVNREGDRACRLRSRSWSTPPERTRASSTARFPSASSRPCGALGASDDLVQPDTTPSWSSRGCGAPACRRRCDFAWGQSLSPVRASVVLALIADAAGSSDAAYQLLVRTMPYHLKAELYDDPALPKQLAMIAATLIEDCHVDEELSEGVFEGGNAALTVLSGSLRGKPLVDAESLALGALALALRGDAPLRQTARASRRSRHRARTSRRPCAPTRSAPWRAPGRSTSAGARRPSRRCGRPTS